MVFTTRGVSVKELRDELELIYSGNLWFRRASVGCDDGGQHVELHITSATEMVAAGAPFYYPGHRVCVIAAPRSADEEDYASASAIEA